MLQLNDPLIPTLTRLPSPLKAAGVKRGVACVAKHLEVVGEGIEYCEYM